MDNWLNLLNGKNILNCKARLICAPFAGAGVSMYRDWHHKIMNVEIIAVHLPGREERMNATLCTNLALALDCIYPEFHNLTEKPYYLFGYSLGARFVYELAVYAQKNGLRPPEHIFIGAARPPFMKRSKKIYYLPDKEFIEEIKDIGGTPDEVFEDNELLEFILPRLRADFSIVDTAPINMGTCVLHSPITAMVGVNDENASPHDMAQWASLTKSDFDLIEFQGAHFFINDFKNKIIDIVSKKMEPITL